jgi:hypothetical protein
VGVPDRPYLCVLRIAARMKIETHLAVVFAVLLAATLPVANGFAQSERTTKLRATDQSGQNYARGSIVKGRTLYEDTGQSAPRERVQLVSSELLANHRDRYRIPTAITDANGGFIFHRVGAGEYYVVVRPADEHLPSAEAAPFPLQNGDAAADAARLEQYKKDFTKITVNGEGPIEIDLRVRNPHFGVISGRIVSANGESVAGANVSAMRTSERVFGTSTRTDENGAYRIIGVPATEYIVSASPPKTLNGGERPKGSEGLLGATYFPSTIDPHNSPHVAVYPDRETGDINITLVARSLHSVAGTVKKEIDGHPVAGATIRLIKKDVGEQASSSPAAIEAAMSNYFSTTDTQGRWSVNNLPDGTYTVFVRPTEVVSADPATQKFAEKRQDLTLAGADLEDLAIEVSAGARISGRVTVEEGNPPTPEILIAAGSAIAKVGSDYTFTATGVPEGEFPLAVIIRPLNVFYVRSIEANGADLLREKLKTRAGEEIKDIHIVISPAAIFSGRVLSAPGGTPLSRIGVTLIPTDPSKGEAFNSTLFGVTNEHGSFVVSGAPGEYFVIVWRLGERAPTRDGDSIKKFSANTLRVTLGPGERKSMDLVK